MLRDLLLARFVHITYLDCYILYKHFTEWKPGRLAYTRVRDCCTAVSNESQWRHLYKVKVAGVTSSWRHGRSTCGCRCACAWVSQPARLSPPGDARARSPRRRTWGRGPPLGAWTRCPATRSWSLFYWPLYRYCFASSQRLIDFIFFKLFSWLFSSFSHLGLIISINWCI